MIKLWENGAPLFDEKIEQEEPSIVEYLVDSQEPRGAVIVCAGGAYCGRTYHESVPVAKMLNDAGFNAFVLNYRLCPYSYPAMLYDIQRAIRVVRYRAKEFNINPEKIGVMGFSAGGHLCIMAMEKFDVQFPPYDEIDKISCRPDAAVLCYPVVSLLQIPDGSPRTSRSLFGGVYNPELAKELTGEFNVNDNNPPVFIWHTSDDEAVNVTNSMKLGMALREKNIQFEMHIYPHGKHGLGLAEGDEVVSRWANEACDWLKRLGF